VQLPEEGKFAETAKFIRLRRYQESAYCMMIGSYLDESFDTRASGVYVVGGIMAQGVPIFELDRRWEALRKRYGIEYFKASECERGSGQFAKFCKIAEKPTPEEKAKLDLISHEFLDLIVNAVLWEGDKHFVVVHGIGIVQADFYEVIKDPKVKAVLGPSPFRLAYDFAMIQCAWAMKQLGPNWGTSFICDADQEHAQAVLPDYFRLKEKNPKAAEYMFSFTAEDEKRCEPLQAADAGVYEVRRALNISLKQWQGPLRKQFGILTQAPGILFLIRHSTKDQLLYIANNNKAGDAFYLDPLMEEEPPEIDITTI
jgi:hypothetical protein